MTSVLHACLGTLVHLPVNNILLFGKVPKKLTTVMCSVNKIIVIVSATCAPAPQVDLQYSTLHVVHKWFN